LLLAEADHHTVTVAATPSNVDQPAFHFDDSFDSSDCTYYLILIQSTDLIPTIHSFMSIIALPTYRRPANNIPAVTFSTCGTLATVSYSQTWLGGVMLIALLLWHSALRVTIVTVSYSQTWLGGVMLIALLLWHSTLRVTIVTVTYSQIHC